MEDGIMSQLVISSRQMILHDSGFTTYILILEGRKKIADVVPEAILVVRIHYSTEAPMGNYLGLAELLDGTGRQKLDLLLEVHTHGSLRQLCSRMMVAIHSDG